MTTAVAISALFLTIALSRLIRTVVSARITVANNPRPIPSTDAATMSGFGPTTPVQDCDLTEENALLCDLLIGRISRSDYRAAILELAIRCEPQAGNTQ